VEASIYGINERELSLSMNRILAECFTGLLGKLKSKKGGSE
jgi:hypothetical protein